MFLVWVKGFLNECCFRVQKCMTQSVALLWTWRYWMYFRSLAELDGLSLTRQDVAQSSLHMISSLTTSPYSPINTTSRATSYRVLSTTLMLRYPTIFSQNSEISLDFLDHSILYQRWPQKIDANNPLYICMKVDEEVVVAWNCSALTKKKLRCDTILSIYLSYHTENTIFVSSFWRTSICNSDCLSLNWTHYALFSRNCFWKQKYVI